MPRPALWKGDQYARIAILGAGPAGLSAACCLREQGYERITLFEQNSRVGGKVHSLPTADGIVEIGAVLASADYTHVLKLANDYGIDYQPYPVPLTFVEQHQQHTLMELLHSRHDAEETAQAIHNYASALQRFACDQPLSQTHSELFRPFAQFAQLHGFMPVAQLAQSILVGFGYGNYEDTPALYLMQIIGWLLKVENGQLQLGEFFTFPSGYLSLWEAVSADFDVRLNARITTITPNDDNGPLHLIINEEHDFEFDALLISAPLNQLSQLMNWPEQHQQLFSQVNSLRYLVNLFCASKLPTETFSLIPEHAQPTPPHRTAAWANRSADKPVYISWQQACRNATPEQLNAALVEDIHNQGGEFKALLLRQEWDYFPHADSQALRNGFFRQLEQLQGQSGIYFIGASLSFETVEHSARQACSLVQQHFPPVQE
jgi:oxygen-dependent protoporphyrinogen oxidase